MKKLNTFIFLFAFACTFSENIFAQINFKKIMNPAFAGDYQKQSVTTTVQFLAAGPTEAFIWGTIPKHVLENKVAFRVVGVGENEPTGFGSVAPHVWIDKKQADLIFELNKGDKINMTGKTYVGKMVVNKDTTYEEIIFLADKITKF